MAKPIYDPFAASSAPGNTLWDLYRWHSTGGDDTTDAATSGIAGVYPYSQIGGGGGGGGEGVTAITPRLPSDIYQGAFDPDDEGTIYPDIAPYGPYTTSRDWDLGVEDVLSPNQLKDPNLLVKGMNWLTRRPKAIESFTGGKGGAGSRAGLYLDEVTNLNTVVQGGYLNADNTGQDIFGVNVVSAFGDYGKKQQEIKDYYDSKSEEELEKLMKSAYHKGRRTNANNVVQANSAIATAQKTTEEATKKIIEDKDITDTKITPGIVAVGGMLPGGQHEITTPPPSQPSYSEIIGASRGNGGGNVTPGSMGMSTVGGGDPFYNKGGRVRYSNGGIVDLL